MVKKQIFVLPPNLNTLDIMLRFSHFIQAFEQIFTKNITLGRANYHADRVLYDIAEIADVGIYCPKK